MLSFVSGNGVATIRLNEALMYMVATDNQPLSIVENTGFKRFCKCAIPLYKLPSRRTFTRMMDNKYDVLCEAMRNVLSNVDRCTLTADVWTDTANVKSYLGMTAHYVECTSMKSVALTVLPLDDSHTADYLAQQMNVVCQKWNIDNSKVGTHYYTSVNNKLILSTDCFTRY